jgi:hypothetical protein
MGATTIAAVATAVTSAIGLTMWFLNRKSAQEQKASEPIEQNRTRKQQIAAEVAAAGDGRTPADANISLQSDLERLRELRNTAGGDQQRPPGGTGDGGRSS